MKFSYLLALTIFTFSTVAAHGFEMPLCEESEVLGHSANLAKVQNKEWWLGQIQLNEQTRQAYRTYLDSLQGCESTGLGVFGEEDMQTGQLNRLLLKTYIECVDSSDRQGEVFESVHFLSLNLNAREELTGERCFFSVP